MNQQLHESLIRKLVANSRAIISYQVGIPVGCVRMDKILYWLLPFEKLNYPIFREYIDAVRGLPLGHERLRWNRESLRKYDERLVAINLEYREKIIDTCFKIIEIHQAKS
jgi:Protein of unknown function (DUF2489)